MPVRYTKDALPRSLHDLVNFDQTSLSFDDDDDEDESYNNEFSDSGASDSEEDC